MSNKEIIETLQGLLDILRAIDEEIHATWRHMDCDPKECGIERARVLIRLLEAVECGDDIGADMRREVSELKRRIEVVGG
jgi:hypothetical protein